MPDYRRSIMMVSRTMKNLPVYRLFSLLLALFVAGCSGTGGGNDTGPDSGKTRVELESEISSNLDNFDTNVDFTLYVQSSNGNTYLHSIGSSSETVSYKSASTSKLVTAVVILSLVNDGVLSLEDNPQKYIASWPTTGNLSQIKLKHLLNFTSGLSNEALCINLPAADFETCVDTIASKNNASTVPGDVFYYGSSHFQVAGLMAIKASGNASWKDLFMQFQSNTGLFLNSTYDLPSDTNPRLAGGMHWIASDYLAFLDALYNRTILNDTLLDLLFSDQIAGATIGESPAVTSLGEDWHYGYGNWMECSANPYDCTLITRVSSPGSFGAYPFIDFENNYYGILARQGALGTFPEGIAIFDSVSSKLASWAAKQ